MLFHFTFVGTYSLAFYVMSIGNTAVVISIQGFVFISYPLIGLLADIKLTRYRMICLSCWVFLIGHLVGSIDSIIGIIGKPLNYHVYDYRYITYFATVVIAFILAVVGKGMFESTVIQFGTDQMIEASSNQLSTFIQWYYWSTFIGIFCINILAIGLGEYFSHCYLNFQNLHDHILGIVLFALALICIVQCLLCCIMLLLLHLKKFKNYLNIEPVGANPVKKIIDVLKYAYHHKYPVRRSALSYYLNTYPSRIDFGKVQYGGPFTNEEVEDTKTVLRLLVLLLSLFGFHLSSDGFSSSNHVLSKSCPSSLILLYIIGDPALLAVIISLFGIPIFRVLAKSSLGIYIPNMLKRMWFGTALLLLKELASLIIYNQVSYMNCEFFDSNYTRTRPSTLLCYLSLIQYAHNTEWNTTDCVNVCQSSELYTMDSTLMWTLVPQILHGFGYMLVFVSVLEFICAQAPFRLKGFVIGIWYAMFSIKYIYINVIEFAIITYFHEEEKVWIIYKSVLMGIMALSLIISGITCRWYRYRERDEVVNIQGMIEDIVENELECRQNEEITDHESTSIAIVQNNYCTFD